jgi:hypothetical protein
MEVSGNSLTTRVASIRHLPCERLSAQRAEPICSRQQLAKSINLLSSCCLPTPIRQQVTSNIPTSPKSSLTSSSATLFSSSPVVANIYFLTDHCTCAEENTRRSTSDYHRLAKSFI